MKRETMIADRPAVADFQSHQNRLRKLSACASHLCGVTHDGKPLGAAVTEYLADMRAGNTDPDRLDARAKYLAKAELDPQIQHELAAIRIETASNYALADLNGAAFFFEVTNLKNDERPVFQNNTIRQTRVVATGGDSGPKRTFKAVESQTELLINLKWLVTDEVRVKKVDIYRGDIMESQNALIMMGYDWQVQIEDECWGLATATPANSGQAGGLFGAFNIGTALRPENDIFVPNRRVNLANLPATNALLAPGHTAVGGKFSFAAIAMALAYEAKWGKSIPGGAPQLTGRILIPALDLTDIASEIVPTGNTNNKVADNILETGWSTVSYLGRTFTLVPDNTLTPGTCYFEFVKKPGVIYLKPGLAVEDKRDDYETRKTNEEFRYAKQPFGAYINFTNRIHALSVKYRKTS